MLLYNLAIYLFAGVAALLGCFLPACPRRKFMKFVGGQRGVVRKARAAMQRDNASAPAPRRVWVHCASLGEYGVARPLISGMHKRGIEVVLTFFSPSGYEVVKDNHPGIEYVSYLPLDTPRNARRFLDAVRPEAAVFIVSEYWFNYLRQLRRRGIPTYLVSAKINPDSAFFKWYGWLHRGCLKAFTRFFVLDERSRQLLGKLGRDNVTVSGNPLFDNAVEKAATDWHDPVVERFCQGRDVFIAGSIHDERDEAMVTALANANPGIPFLLVPHAVSDEHIGRLRSALQGRSVRHSECGPDTPLDGVQVMVIDFVGALAYIYRHCRWAYVGGGFTPYLHSLVEAVVYGLPVSFGPCIQRKITPEQLIDIGVGAIVNDSHELGEWFDGLKDNPAALERVSERAAAYVKANSGVTDAILTEILGSPTPKPQSGAKA